MPMAPRAPEYRAGGAYRPELRGHGRLHAVAGLPGVRRAGRAAEFARRQLPPATPPRRSSYDPVTGVPVVISGVDARWRLGGTFGFLPCAHDREHHQPVPADGGLPRRPGPRRLDLGALRFARLARARTSTTSASCRRRAGRRWPPRRTSARARRSRAAGTTLGTCTSGLPVFGGTITEDCVKAISARYTDRTRISQDIVEATAQGALFSLPAGEVRGAVGLTHRKNDFQYLPDASRDPRIVPGHPGRRLRPGQCVRSDHGQGNLRRVAGAGAQGHVPGEEPRAGTGLPLLGLRHLGQGAHLEGAVQLVTRGLGCASAAATRSPTARRTSTSCSSMPARRR